MRKALWLLILLPCGVKAGVIHYEWVCERNCEDAPAFQSVLKITEEAYEQREFTGVDGNIVGWLTESAAVGGVTTTLSDLLERDARNIRVVLSDDGSSVTSLLEDGGLYLDFVSEEGLISWSTGPCRDTCAYGPNLVDRFDPFERYFYNIGGRFVIAVPEPSTLALLGAGLVGLGVMRRRRA